MARKARKNKETKNTVLMDAIMEGVKKHLVNHLDEALVIADESENKKVSISFPCLIDMSKTETGVDVKMRFSQSVTDSVSYTLDDPAQGTFEEITKAASGTGESQEPDDTEKDS